MKKKRKKEVMHSENNKPLSLGNATYKSPIKKEILSYSNNKKINA